MSLTDTHAADVAGLADHVEQIAQQTAADDPSGTVHAIDALLRDVHRLRSALVTENIRRHHELMAELDAKYGPLESHSPS